jgi:arylsulfatase A-like enzyme
MKRLSSSLFLSLYAAALLFSLIVAFKAGASFFYYKIILQPENFQPDLGFAYRYRVNLPPAIFPPDKVLVFENGKQLALKGSGEVIQDGDGAYTTDTSTPGSFYIYLAPKENSDPLTDGKTYRLYLANIFLSRTTGILYFSILLFGFLRFGIFAFSPSVRSKLRSLPGLLQISDDFIQHLKATVSTVNTHTYISWRSMLTEAMRLLIFTAGAAYALVFMEWLFQVTKPSYMDGMSLGQKLEIFLLSGLALTIAGFMIDLALLLIGLLLRWLRSAWLSVWISAVVPALLLTALIVLWFDHFTYTLFHYGILTTSNQLRTVYGIFIMLFFLMVYRWMLSTWGLLGTPNKTPSSYKIFSYFMLGLLVISILIALVQLNNQLLKAKFASTPPPKIQNLPNIILIGSDGLSARNMSLYGYSRDTTPNINRLAQDSLVAENAISNSGNTNGSIGSILTGKMPTRTRMLHPPDILQGIDRYEHLPKILKDLGYTTVELGVPYYVDAYNMNFQDGFDTVNQRSIKEDVLVQALHSPGFDLPATFIQTLEENFVDRFLHAFYLKTVENPYSIVTHAGDAEEDVNKIQDLLELFAEPTAPVFVHAHLMVTHGSRFRPIVQTFSAGKQQDQDWMPDFYDDSILTFDQQIGKLVEGLKANGQYDNTILILYADHAMGWSFNERIPLLIHFPGDQYKGKLQYNVQNLDISPTIVDYLGLPIPSWMEGRSLLRPETGERRLIFSVVTNPAANRKAKASISGQNNHQFETSNYEFSVIQVVDCQRWYRLDFQTYEWTSGDIFQHTSPCPEDTLLDMAQIKQAVIQHLSSLGFDTSSIP